MIDKTIMERDAAYNMAEWPIALKYGDRPIRASVQGISDISLLLDGGLLDDRNVSVLAIASDFGDDLPPNRSLIDLQTRNGSWKKFEITSIPDRYDTSTPLVNIQIANPSK